MQAQPAPAEAPLHYNRDLLALMPAGARGVVEIGCNTGALARAYKAANPTSHYTGIDIDASFVERSAAYCDQTLLLNIETADDAFFASYAATSNVWVFGDVLEHLRDPWTVLAKIRRALPADGCIVVCLPNTQHWTVQAKLCIGDLRYEDTGLLDRTHIRFFTRATMLEMFAGAGLRIEQGHPRIFGALENPHIIAAIRSMALGCGADPDLALQDAQALQYVVRAVAA